jgi:uncharacterized protein (TIGR03437 family)
MGMSTHRSLTLASALLVFTTALPAQTLSYTLLSSEGPRPSARFDGTIAYDPSARRIYLFGGEDTAPRNDLWTYSLADRRWQEVQVSGAKPPARFGHTLIFDSSRKRVVVFGGQATGFFTDVWAFDTTQSTWQQLNPDGDGPSRRYGHSAVYDVARDRMVISHGFTNAGRFDDTWAFDLISNTWRDLSPNGSRPLRRCLHHAVLDSAANQMYLYGGCASGFGPCPLGDLWAFDLATNRWTERTGQLKPPPREHYGIGFDSARGRLVIFGGTGNGTLNDTWDYDPRSGMWLQPVINGDTPSARHRHESTSAPDRGTIFFFGGLTASGPTNELWMLGPGFLIARPEVASGGVVNAFSGAADAVAPGEIVSIFGSGLGPIEGVSFGFDSLRGELPMSGPGVSATWNGIPAPLYFVRSDQLNVQVPYEVAGAPTARLVVTVNGQSSDAVAKPVVATRPGLFPRIWNQDGSVNTPDNPAVVGSVVVLYATGQGLTVPSSRTGAAAIDVYPEPQAPTSVTIAGRQAEVIFKGQAPSTVGVMQINARVPRGVGSGATEVVLTIGDRVSQAGVSAFVR